MAPRYVRVLVISAGVILVTGLLASWMTGFDQPKIKVKSFINPSTSTSDEAQTSVEALAGNGGAPNTPKAQTITNFPGTASVKMTSATSVVSRASSAAAIDEASQQTPAERAAVSPAGGIVTTSESTGELKTAIASTTKQADRLETAETTLDETITCTQIIESSDVETFTNTPESTSVSDIIQTDVTVLGKQTDVSITEAKQETTSFAQTITTANTKSATPITQPMTDRILHFITDTLQTLKITSENKATTEARPDVTFGTAAIIAETKVDLTEGNSVASTVIKRLKTEGTETPKIETSETTTVRPQESTEAIKPSHAPTTANGASGMNLITMIQTSTQEKTKGKQLSTGGTSITKSNVLTTLKSILKTISPKRQTVKVFKKLTTRPHKPCTGKCQSKSTTKSTVVRRARVKSPIVYDKTLYSAITMGCILIICAILALIVFIKDFTMR